MEIIINDHRKIFAIQEEFNTMFPFLKLEFLSKPHEPDGAPGKKFVKQHSKTLGECRTIHKKGNLTITPNMTVAELEEHFREVYGLAVEVFRKFGETWLETSPTASWTLEKQNLEGKTLAKVVK